MTHGSLSGKKKKAESPGRTPPQPANDEESASSEDTFVSPLSPEQPEVMGQNEERVRESSSPIAAAEEVLSESVVENEPIEPEVVEKVASPVAAAEKTISESGMENLPTKPSSSGVVGNDPMTPFTAANVCFPKDDEIPDSVMLKALIDYESTCVDVEPIKSFDDRVISGKKRAAPGSIEKRVKVNKRGKKKKLDANWEYNTPQSLKKYEKDQKKNRVTSRIQLIVIDGINTQAVSWNNLESNVQQHYADFFKTGKEIYYENFVDGPDNICITKAAIKDLIEEKEVDIEIMKKYIEGLGELVNSSSEGFDKFAFFNHQFTWDCFDHNRICRENNDTISGKEYDIAISLFELLWSSFYKENIFIPMHHKDSNHYSLLHVDNKNHLIVHYNSILLPIDEDHCHDNAVAATDQIKKWVGNVALTGMFDDSEIDYEEFREYPDRLSQGGCLLTKIIPLDDDTRKSRNFILNNHLRGASYNFVRATNMPLQLAFM